MKRGRSRSGVVSSKEVGGLVYGVMAHWLSVLGSYWVANMWIRKHGP